MDSINLRPMFALCKTGYYPSMGRLSRFSSGSGQRESSLGQAMTSSPEEDEQAVEQIAATRRLSGAQPGLEEGSPSPARSKRSRR